MKLIFALLLINFALQYNASAGTYVEEMIGLAESGSGEAQAQLGSDYLYGMNCPDFLGGGLF